MLLKNPWALQAAEKLAPKKILKGFVTRARLQPGQ
jgi:hypothetical protein